MRQSRVLPIDSEVHFQTQFLVFKSTKSYSTSGNTKLTTFNNRTSKTGIKQDGLHCVNKLKFKISIHVNVSAAYVKPDRSTITRTSTYLLSLLPTYINVTCGCVQIVLKLSGFSFETKQAC